MNRSPTSGRTVHILRAGRHRDGAVVGLDQLELRLRASGVRTPDRAHRIATVARAGQLIEHDRPEDRPLARRRDAISARKGRRGVSGGGVLVGQEDGGDGGGD
uniref:Uncharacterized protein n=1 Tax=Plectus sambesii TaxID=2011161 RepID=A0A914V0W4_9BILA